MSEHRILISRTDSIGDSVLTLPLCGYLKKVIPDSRIIYLGQPYTRPVVTSSAHIDEFIEFSESESAERLTAKLRAIEADTVLHVFPRKEVALAAKRAGIRTRIGTGGRFYHVYTCNKLVRFSRKRSDLHESQLNFKLLEGLGIKYTPALNAVPDMYGLDARKSPRKTDKIILHPGSRGSAVDWSVDKFSVLADKLVESGKTVYITGSEDEGKSIRDHFSFSDRLIDVTGQLSLAELIDFISSAEALVACSTGPLHIAAALDVHTVGLYVDIRPIHPGRWAPVGNHVTVVTPLDSTSTAAIDQITPDMVLDCLNKLQV